MNLRHLLSCDTIVSAHTEVKSGGEICRDLVGALKEMSMDTILDCLFTIQYPVTGIQYYFLRVH